MTQQPLSAIVARHIAETPYSALTPGTVAATRCALLDGIGVILAASGMSREADPFVALSSAQPGTATILGHGTRVPAAAAAFANGALAHALDFEDAFDAAPTHPNASLIPAALAVAESHGPVSGDELIAAVAIGCDLVCRLGLSLRRTMEEGGWYPPPILGAFGAAAAAARLMRLTPRQIQDAFSLLLCQVSCPGEIKYSADTVIRAVREAFPAQAAVISAELAARGVRGFDAPLEGRAGFFRLYVGGDYDPADILDGLGERFWIERLSFKPWPACRGTHGYIEAALGLAANHGFAARDIEAIGLEGGDVQAMLFEPEARKKRPATAIDAKFSLPFTVALALVRGQVGLDGFDAETLADPDILALAERVSYRQRPGWGRDRAASAALEILLRDGRTLSAELDVPLGHPDRPLSDVQLRAKFVACAARAARPLSRGAADTLADRWLSLDREADVGAVIRLCAGDASA
ncbi:MmgE/PrpD family protein [Allosphingosinicella deserti]|uniref:2-methylcitrate dehydratase n=1 Tax=Allosphingosinicella deserti TaxID=2116704 RepID=A0A2P7QVV2_9SPHN|nr:MmgE/PrpD family protein [Sphingomonas deserti]PSJ42070.1 2-methylcitrate dehydratase [Sphingomonas deserti]